MSLSIAATSANLIRYLAETPASVEKSLTRKETIYSVAAKVSAVAAVVFFVIPLFVTGASGCILAAIISTRAFVNFEKRKQETKYQKDLYAGVAAKESEQIIPGETKGIEAFFKEAGGSIEQIPPTTMAALAKINPQAPLDALKPLIIRYQEADIVPYGMQVLLQKGLLAATLLRKADMAENRDRLEKLAQNEATLFRLVPHYRNQQTECAALLGLKA